MRIQQSEDGHLQIRPGISRIDIESIAVAQTPFQLDLTGRCIALNIEDLYLMDRDAIWVLELCGVETVQLRNCPQYIRDWLAREGHSS
jgi:hypothetical protein